MTLPSLCSAIRSQLYFSQIVAWCDLLRKCDPSVYDSGRVIFSSCGNNAGDLATAYSPSGGGQKRPRLNIFYRIKQHTVHSNSGHHQEDGFSAKANVHNFPNVNVSESYSISVSVRSLPRINGGLPHVEPLPPSPAPRSLRSCGGGDPASTPTGGGGLHAATRTGNGSGSTGSPSSSSLTHQRWTQKLCQLRQISPAAQTMSAEPELVSLAINDLNKDHGDYEIVRRVMLNRAGGMGGLVSNSGGGGGGGGGTNNSSAASSPGSNSSDNILHSLQSLATTCLRGGPALAPPPVEPRPLNLAFLWSGSGGSGGRGLGLGLGAAAAASAIAAGSISNTPTTTTATATASSGASSSASRPKHGPHCDQFLRKMGLAKGEMPSEAEEHICDMSYVNMTVSGMFR